eukprot:XP_001703202.1 predicted protein [Chlamydomonas reinhardtii]
MLTLGTAVRCWEALVAVRQLVASQPAGGMAGSGGIGHTACTWRSGLRASCPPCVAANCAEPGLAAGRG